MLRVSTERVADLTARPELAEDIRRPEKRKTCCARKLYRACSCGRDAEQKEVLEEITVVRRGPEGKPLRVEVRQIGIVLFLLGLLLLGLSIGFRESEEEAIVRRASLRRHVLIGYRVRIRRWIFWSGLVLMAVGALLQW